LFTRYCGPNRNIQKRHLYREDVYNPNKSQGAEVLAFERSRSIYEEQGLGGSLAGTCFALLSAFPLFFKRPPSQQFRFKTSLSGGISAQKNALGPVVAPRHFACLAG